MLVCHSRIPLTSPPACEATLCVLQVSLFATAINRDGVSRVIGNTWSRSACGLVSASTVINDGASWDTRKRDVTLVAVRKRIVALPIYGLRKADGAPFGGWVHLQGSVVINVKVPIMG